MPGYCVCRDGATWPRAQVAEDGLLHVLRIVSFVNVCSHGSRTGPDKRLSVSMRSGVRLARFDRVLKLMTDGRNQIVGGKPGVDNDAQVACATGRPQVCEATIQALTTNRWATSRFDIHEDRRLFQSLDQSSECQRTFVAHVEELLPIFSLVERIR